MKYDWYGRSKNLNSRKPTQYLEVRQIKAELYERKHQLKAQGLGRKQQDKDARVIELGKRLRAATETATVLGSAAD